MQTYVFKIEQVIEIKAKSRSEAEFNLPMYPTGFGGQKYYVREETVEEVIK